MNKEELQKLIDSYNLPKDEYYLICGGALVIYGLRDKTEDMDICVTPNLFEYLKVNYSVEKEAKSHGTPIYLVDNTFECIVKDIKDFHCEMKNNYPVEDLKDILEFKQKRNLPKDKPDIQKIMQIININGKK